MYQLCAHADVKNSQKTKNKHRTQKQIKKNNSKHLKIQKVKEKQNNKKLIKFKMQKLKNPKTPKKQVSPKKKTKRKWREMDGSEIGVFPLLGEDVRDGSSLSLWRHSQNHCLKSLEEEGMEQS